MPKATSKKVIASPKLSKLQISEFKPKAPQSQNAMLSSPSEKTKILILAANPKDTDELRLAEEVREIDEGLLRSHTPSLLS